MTHVTLEVPGFSSLITVFPVDAAPTLGESALGREVLLVSDRNTESVAAEVAAARIPPASEFTVAGSVTLPPGEDQKSIENVELLLDTALDLGLSRNALFAVFGGGVLCDFAAFAASIYLRGVHLQLFPTTLLAMVDAAVGGKTGTNFRGYKNMVGTFYPADEVRIYPRFVATLSEGEYRSGLAEVIKAALLGEEDLLTLLEQESEAVIRREPSILEEIISRSLRVKVDVVEEDLRESGRRAILNLGHTFGHALESVAEFKGYTHGEAVAWGIGRAMILGELLGVTDPSYRRRVFALLEDYGYNLAPLPYDPKALIEAMGQDKKRLGSQIRFILQRDLGETELLPADPALVEKSLVAEVGSGI
ncbi:MAG: 3-dehydroquinate synthase [Alkalispirochaetaceae bacterium]